MVFSSIKSDLRKEYIFFKKFILFYLLISQALINCEMKVFPDHFSKDDPNFSKSQVKTITPQQFYYDLGYFTEKTEKYRSSKYGIQYRPVQCQKMTETDPDLVYETNDNTSFFGNLKGIKDRYSTLEMENKFDDTKLFLNTIKGKNFSCPSPIRAFHSDNFLIKYKIPMTADSNTELEMFLYSNDGQYNESRQIYIQTYHFI